MPKVVFHTHIPELKHFMEDLPRIFDEEGTTIKTGRNEIKIIERGGVQFCVKAFNKVAALNILMYSWFRQTKAKRSFLTARALLQRGIETPMPIGYTEVIGGGKIVRQSFYVSLYQHFDWHLADALQRDHPEEQAITAAYGRFMAEKVHPAGIWHKDMSTGNIMINRNRGKYAFSIVDLNRICFKKKISPAAGLYNMRKLKGSALKLALMAQQYALATGHDPAKLIYQYLRYQTKYYSKREKSKKILHALDPTRKKKS